MAPVFRKVEFNHRNLQTNLKSSKKRVENSSVRISKKIVKQQVILLSLPNTRKVKESKQVYYNYDNIGFVR